MNERIKKLRKTLGLTLKSFSTKVGMSISGISDVEKDEITYLINYY